MIAIAIINRELHANHARYIIIIILLRCVVCVRNYVDICNERDILAGTHKIKNSNA